MTDTAPKMPQQGPDDSDADDQDCPDRAASHEADQAERPKEIGGRKGPEPTRYGDWEKNGRCIDF